MLFKLLHNIKYSVSFVLIWEISKTWCEMLWPLMFFIKSFEFINSLFFCQFVQVQLVLKLLLEVLGQWLSTFSLLFYPDSVYAKLRCVCVCMLVKLDATLCELWHIKWNKNEEVYNNRLCCSIFESSFSFFFHYSLSNFHTFRFAIYAHRETKIQYADSLSAGEYGNL